MRCGPEAFTLRIRYGKLADREVARRASGWKPAHLVTVIFKELAAAMKTGSLTRKGEGVHSEYWLVGPASFEEFAESVQSVAKARAVPLCP